MTTSLLDLLVRVSGRPLRTYSKRVLIDLSHDVEARVDAAPPHPPLVFGGFQRDGFFAVERARWERMSAAATLTVVAAAGLRPSPAAGGRPLVCIDVGAGDPFETDWLALVYAGPAHGGVVIARDEEGGPDVPTDARTCRGLWTYDPRVAHVAATWVGEYLRGHDPVLAERWRTGIAILAASSADPGARALRRAG